jgi:hypothetical protein
VGPVLEHYRGYQLYVPDTNGLRITSTAEFFPTYTTMPTLSSSDLATDAAERLIHALQHPSFPAPYKSIAPRHLEALTKLAEIFNTATHESPPPSKVPRVAIPAKPKPKPAPNNEIRAPPRVPLLRSAIPKLSSEPTAKSNTYQAAPVHTRYLL